MAKVEQVLRGVLDSQIGEHGAVRSVQLSALRTFLDVSYKQVSCGQALAPEETREAVAVFPDSGSELRCVTCGCSFAKVEEQREHFKTDWHRLNQRLKSRGKAALSVEAAEAVLNSGDTESLSGSASEDSSDVEEGEELKSQPAQRSFADQINLRIKGFPEIRAQAYGALVLDGSRCCIDYEILEEEKYWIILMYSAGHFAGVVYKQDVVVATKTFHRYVVRKGQGGSQSAKDNTGKRAKSAGATLRRYNEQLLWQEIADLLKSWKDPFIEQAVRVFVAVSRAHRNVLFRDRNVLASNDSRIRRVPFITKRPTVKEAKRSMDRLRSVRLFKLEAVPSPVETSSKEFEKGVAKLEVKEKEPIAPPQTVEDVPEDPVFAELRELIKLGNIDGLSKKLLGEDSEILLLTDQEGQTLLHHASHEDNASIITLLLERGVSPEFRDSHGRTAYQMCSKKLSRDAFRLFMGKHPSQWDYHKAQIPSPLTDAMADARKEKNKLKKKRQAERRRKKKLEQQQQKMEAGAVQTAKSHPPDAPLCAFCTKPLGGEDDFFARLDLKYCSSKCVQDHRRQLAAEAALRRARGPAS